MPFTFANVMKRYTEQKYVALAYGEYGEYGEFSLEYSLIRGKYYLRSISELAICYVSFCRSIILVKIIILLAKVVTIIIKPKILEKNRY